MSSQSWVRYEEYSGSTFLLRSMHRYIFDPQYIFSQLAKKMSSLLILYLFPTSHFLSLLSQHGSAAFYSGLVAVCGRSILLGSRPNTKKSKHTERRGSLVLV